MSFEDIQTASVIRYPYLWVREAGRGETEGRKYRPVAGGVLIARIDGDVLLLKVDQMGPACHTCAPSCFFRKLG